MLVVFVWGRYQGFSSSTPKLTPVEGQVSKMPPAQPAWGGSTQLYIRAGPSHFEHRKKQEIAADSRQQSSLGRPCRLGQVSEFWSGQNILCQNASAGTFLHCNLPTHPTWTHYLWLARNMKKSARFVKKTLQQTRGLSLAYQSNQFAPQFFLLMGAGLNL